MNSSSSELCVVAADAARAAGALLLERFWQGGEEVRTKSTLTDPVSEADLSAERAIREVLQARRPGDAILGEEGGQSAGEETAGGASGLRWIVDPLDGTVNFLYGMGHWCVSVAVHDDEGGLAGVVFDPVRDELFAAERGGVPTLNGRPLEGSRVDELSMAMVATGFAYDAAVRERQGAVVAAMLPRVRDVRRFGSAALDLAWAAAGRVDAYFERTVKLWDIAAGSLLCERAGLIVRRLEPSGDDLPEGLLVAPAGLIEALESMVA